MAKLPDNLELSKLFALGYSNKKIAQMYGATAAAVDYRLHQIGLWRMPTINQVNTLIGQVWKVKATTGAGSHHNQGPIQYLKYWLRVRLGDSQMSDQQIAKAMRFEQRLRKELVVVAYDPETVAGFSYVSRLPSDEQLVIRWPEDVPYLDPEEMNLLRLSESQS
ncbi:hypothetical protein ACFY2K_11975 [Kitasatospora sp. NPDC001309]